MELRLIIVVSALVFVLVTLVAFLIAVVRSARKHEERAPVQTLGEWPALPPASERVVDTNLDGLELHVAPDSPSAALLTPLRVSSWQPPLEPAPSPRLGELSLAERIAAFKPVAGEIVNPAAPEPRRTPPPASEPAPALEPEPEPAPVPEPAPAPEPEPEPAPAPEPEPEPAPVPAEPPSQPAPEPVLVVEPAQTPITAESAPPPTAPEVFMWEAPTAAESGSQVAEASVDAAPAERVFDWSAGERGGVLPRGEDLAPTPPSVPAHEGVREVAPPPAVVSDVETISLVASQPSAPVEPHVEAETPEAAAPIALAPEVPPAATWQPPTVPAEPVVVAPSAPEELPAVAVPAVPEPASPAPQPDTAPVAAAQERPRPAVVVRAPQPAPAPAPVAQPESRPARPHAHVRTRLSTPVDVLPPRSGGQVLEQSAATHGPRGATPVLTMVAPVEMWFGDARVGVKAGTKTYEQFRKYADVLLADLKGKHDPTR